ncbi:MAG TPA: Hsp20/alpha crystallin family protein [Gemmatimonadaceae bacterium]|nr:Hsp20/alpha crystallin family protein [Gemmatimonadaceae bacterium]
MTKITMPRPMPLFTTTAREMDEVQNRLRRFFNEAFPAFPGDALPMAEPLGWMPAVEIIENAEEMILTAELPGLAKENVEVTFEEDVLTIRGEKKEEKKEGNGDKRFHVWERTYGAFRRSFTLPRTVDPGKIVAEFKDGVLTVRMPKAAQAKAKGRKIAVTAK